MTARRSERLLSAGYYIGESDEALVSYKETPVKPFNKRRHGRYSTRTSIYSGATPSASCASVRSFGSNASVPSAVTSAPDERFICFTQRPFNKRRHGSYSTRTFNYSGATPSASCASVRSFGSNASVPAAVTSAPEEQLERNSYWGYASANVERFSGRWHRYCVSRITAVPGALLSLGMVLMLVYCCFFEAAWNTMVAVAALPTKFFLSRPFNSRRHGRYSTRTSNYSGATPSASCASVRSFGSSASVPSAVTSAPDERLERNSYWGHASANLERFSGERLRCCISGITVIPGALFSLGMTLMLAYRWWFVATWNTFVAVATLPAKFFLSRDMSKRKAFVSLAFGSFLLGLWCLFVKGPNLAQVIFPATQQTEQIYEHNAELHLLSRVAALESHMQSLVSQEKLEKLHDCKKLLLGTEVDQSHVLPSLTREELIYVAEDFLNKREAALCHRLKETLIQQVNDIVDQALKLYSEDRIGLVDYALESAGGWIVSTRCSETFKTKTVLFSFLGIPLFYHSQTPRAIIQPEVYPGNCWAFRGSEGFAVIHLATLITPRSFTIDHLPKSLSPTGTITSAPREFAVYGLEDKTAKKGTLLGNYVYEESGAPVQTFKVQDMQLRAYRAIELKVLSNWGNPEFTCIYRFRVHGDPVS